MLITVRQELEWMVYRNLSILQTGGGVGAMGLERQQPCPMSAAGGRQAALPITHNSCRIVHRPPRSRLQTVAPQLDISHTAIRNEGPQQYNAILVD